MAESGVLPMTQLPTKSDSLGTILAKLVPVDDDLAPQDFDPAVVVGDLRDKIDAVKWRLDDWEYKVKMLKQAWIKPIQAKIKSLEGKRERLKDYVKSQMIEHGFDKLPGNAIRAELRALRKSIIFDREPLFIDYKAYPGLVTQVVSYKWNSEAVREALEGGKELSFARFDEAKALHFPAQDSLQISGEISDE